MYIPTNSQNAAFQRGGKKGRKRRVRREENRRKGGKRLRE